MHQMIYVYSLSSHNSLSVPLPGLETCSETGHDGCLVAAGQRVVSKMWKHVEKCGKKLGNM